MAEHQVFSFLHPALMTTSSQCHSLTRSFSQQAINDTTTHRSQEPAVPPARSVARHPTDHKLLSIEVLARNSKVHSFLGPILQVSLNFVLDIEKIFSTIERVSRLQETSRVCSSPAGTLDTLNRIEDGSRRGTRGRMCISEVTTADCSHSHLVVIMLHLDLQVVSDIARQLSHRLPQSSVSCQ
jgi:hypothetical protein